MSFKELDMSTSILMFNELKTHRKLTIFLTRGMLANNNNS